MCLSPCLCQSFVGSFCESVDWNLEWESLGTIAPFFMKIFLLYRRSGIEIQINEGY